MIINRKEHSKTKRNKITTFFLYLKSYSPLLLSHHPECEKFKEHTFKIKNYKVCIGCSVGYLTAIITLIIINFLNLIKIIDSQYFLILGLIFLGTFILGPLHIINSKKVKTLQKILIGIGTIFIISWIGTLPNSPKINLILIFIVICIVLWVLNVYHGYGFFNTCKKCDTPMDFENCPGFERIRNSLKKYNLIEEN